MTITSKLLDSAAGSLLSNLVRLWRHLRSSRKRKFKLLLALMLFSSVAEVINIGAVLPFLVVLLDPSRLYENEIAKPIFEFLGFTAPNHLLLPLTLFFIVAVILSNVLRLGTLWATSRLSYMTGAELSLDIYKRTLYQPYPVHIARNSSEIVNGISMKANAAITFIMVILNLISAILVLFAIMLVLTLAAPILAAIIFSMCFLIYGTIILSTRKRVAIYSQSIARESTQAIKFLQEGLGSIRDVLIDGTQEIYCSEFHSVDVRYRNSLANSHFIGQSPRYLLEGIGMISIAGLAFFLALEEDGIALAIPVLGVAAITAQRVLPLLQQLYLAWTNIKISQVSLIDTLVLLEQPLPTYLQETDKQKLPFEDNISLRDLSFRHTTDQRWLLKNINLEIKKGNWVAVVGATGSGKSTFVDILMGLLIPTQGCIEVDGISLSDNNYRGWQKHIAHVPQAVFLSDATIAENIAFGVPLDKINHDEVRVAAQKAQIAEDIESWPSAYQTMVGERGAKLSGGQRQRIGIARALYKKSDVIILDEATNALDKKTELQVMDALKRLANKVTFIVVTHKMANLGDFNEIFEVENGSVVSRKEKIFTSEN